MGKTFKKDHQFYRFCLYGFLKNLRFYEPFLLLFLLSKLNNNYTLAFSLYSIRFIIRTVLEIPSGIIADAMGRKGSLLFAYSFYILSFIAYYFASSYTLLLIPSILFGIGDAFRTGTHKAMILEYLKIKGWSNSKVSYYGYTRSWSQAGSAVSSIIASIVILTSNNYDIIFIATTLPYIIGFILLYNYPKELDKKISIERSVFSNLKASLADSLRTLKKPKIVGLLFNASFYFGFHNAIKDLLQPIIIAGLAGLHLNLNINEQQKASVFVGFLYFIIYLLSSFASRKANVVNNLFGSDKKTINILAGIGVILCLITSIFIYLGIPFAGAFLFIPFFPIISLQRPPVVSHVSSNVDGKIMATTLSVESQMGSAITAILAFITGVAVDHFGLAIGLGIVSLSSLLIIMSFILLNIKNEKNHPGKHQ